MQNPLAFTSLSSFVENLQNEITLALGQSISAGKDDLQGLFEFLHSCNGVLLEKNRRLIKRHSVVLSEGFEIRTALGGVLLQERNP